jgi:hypothetical protein
MFHPITIPADAKMLFNVVKLKPEYKIEDIELLLGEMCNVVKNTYGDDNGGFIAGQVFKFAGFISNEGSFDSKKMTEDHIAIVTYWQSFEQHEKSHSDETFNNKFTQLAEYCEETYEIGYDLLWQGVPE